jgi:ferredoxin-NADP reductase
MRPDILTKIEGYDRIVREREICRKYGTDFGVERGAVEAYVKRLHPDRLFLKVFDIIDETPSAKTFRLVPAEGPLPPFQAGQYISVCCDIGGVRTGRPYSLSSPPNRRGHYDITVKAVEDGFVSSFLLSEVRRGDVLETSGPAGLFHYNPILHDREWVFLAGGSGVTPFMSMIREAVECGLDNRIWLFHGDREAGEAIFREELERIAARFPNIRYIPVIENPSPGYDGACGGQDLLRLRSRRDVPVLHPRTPVPAGGRRKDPPGDVRPPPVDLPVPRVAGGGAGRGRLRRLRPGRETNPGEGGGTAPGVPGA